RRQFVSRFSGGSVAHGDRRVEPSRSPCAGKRPRRGAARQRQRHVPHMPQRPPTVGKNAPRRRRKCHLCELPCSGIKKNSRPLHYQKCHLRLLKDFQMDYEHLPGDGPLDETDVSLRSYLTSLSDEHLAKYDRAWSDEQVMAWDGNFRSDGVLMLVCCERDIDV